MEPSVLAPRKPKPPRWWAFVTLAAGALGFFVALGVAGRGTYDIPPFVVQLSASPAYAGKTQLELKPAATGISPGHAEAGTHAGPLVLGATVTDVTVTPAPSDIVATTTPQGFADFLAANGRDAMQAFAIRLAIVGLLGSIAAGVAISFGRWQRILGALVAGVLTLAGVGALVATTYDAGEFSNTSFRPTQTAPTDDVLPNGDGILDVPGS